MLGGFTWDTTLPLQGTYPIWMFTRYVLPGLFSSWIPNPQRILVLFDHSYIGCLVQFSKSVSPRDYFLSWILNPQGVLVRDSYSIFHSPSQCFSIHSTIISPGLVYDTWRIMCPSSLPPTQGGYPYSSNMEDISYSILIRETSSQSLVGLILHQCINCMFFPGDIVVVARFLSCITSYLGFDL